MMAISRMRRIAKVRYLGQAPQQESGAKEGVQGGIRIVKDTIVPKTKRSIRDTESRITMIPALLGRGALSVMILKQASTHSAGLHPERTTLILPKDHPEVDLIVVTQHMVRKTNRSMIIIDRLTASQTGHIDLYPSIQGIRTEHLLFPLLPADKDHLNQAGDQDHLHGPPETPLKDHSLCPLLEHSEIPANQGTAQSEDRVIDQGRWGLAQGCGHRLLAPKREGGGVDRLSVTVMMLHIRNLILYTEHVYRNTGTVSWLVGNGRGLQMRQ